MVKEKRRYFKSMLSSLEIMKKDEDNKPAKLRLRTTTQPFKRTKSFSIGAPRHYVAGGNTAHNAICAKVQNEALRTCNGCLWRERENLYALIILLLLH